MLIGLPRAVRARPDSNLGPSRPDSNSMHLSGPALFIFDGPAPAPDFGMPESGPNGSLVRLTSLVLTAIKNAFYSGQVLKIYPYNQHFNITISPLCVEY